MTAPAFDVVVPTVGRESLARLLGTLAACGPPWPETLVVVDDSGQGKAVPTPPVLAGRTRILRTRGRQGPAAARNLGWRATSAPFVAFLDDDVLVSPEWTRRLVADLESLDRRTAAVQGRLSVPRASRPSDRARTTARLEGARWITADLAVRRDALDDVGGFDERFPRAYREDTDLALRLQDRGWRLTMGGRRSEHPVRPAPWWVSVPQQRGNADDVLLAAIHGPYWRRRVGEAPGLFRCHVMTTAALVVAAGAAVTGRRRLAAGGAATWLLLTAALIWRRVAPGPRTAGEVLAMAATSAAIPPVAVAHRVAGHLRHRRAPAWTPPSEGLRGAGVYAPTGLGSWP